jgi:hypothetical protein
VDLLRLISPRDAGIMHGMKFVVSSETGWLYCYSDWLFEIAGFIDSSFGFVID